MTLSDGSDGSDGMTLCEIKHNIRLIKTKSSKLLLTFQISCCKRFKQETKYSHLDNTVEIDCED